MLKRIGLVVLALVVVLLIVIATRPDTFEIKRSTVIKAPQSIVYAQVASFPNWVAWSPWEGMDPSMSRTYNGSASGNGAHYEWRGNDKAGAGTMTITDDKPTEHLGLDLEMIEPYAGKNRVDFDFVKKDDTTTEVTWQMSGKNGFPQKAAGLFFNIDTMVGGDFEKGLAKLKTVSEASAAAAEKAALESAAAAAAVDGTQATDAGAAPDAGDGAL